MERNDCTALLGTKEQKKLLEEFNETYKEYRSDKTINMIFEEQVMKTPDNIALIFRESKLTYKELNEKANQLARILRKDRNIKDDSIVGIMMNRSLEMIIGILAILKAGGAYLPIAPNYPVKRIDHIVSESKLTTILTEEIFIGELNKLSNDVEIIDIKNSKIYSGESSNLERINTPHNLAYVIYTSGSTGNPKGVMIENHSVVNRIDWMQSKYPINENDVILQKTPYTFDVSVWELFWWFFVGARVCILEPNGEKEPEVIINEIERCGVTTLHFVPSMLNVFLNYIEESSNENYLKKLISIRQVFASGEALHINQVIRFNNTLRELNGAKLINLYGPTEATVDVTYYDCCEEREDGIIPIGKPIDNIKLYILDEKMNIVPIGEQGELYIYGVGVSRGYLNNEKLTKERFIDNPFESEGKIYKTGDLAKWDYDGNVIYLGRMDHQVKVRGFRIELGEVEKQILKYEGINEAVVIDIDDEKGNKFLASYFVGNVEIDVEKLKTFLNQSLLEYMIPSYFMQLDKMPLTQNGKLDRKSLPKPQNKFTEYVEAVTDTEKAVQEIWSEILEIDKLGIRDNFIQVGGESLKAIKILSKIRNKLNVTLKVSDIFKYSTVEKLSIYIDAIISINKDCLKEEGNTSIEKVEKKEYYETSSAQKRMYAIYEVDKENVQYNSTYTISTKEKFNVDKTQKCINEIIKRHESLRTSFHVVNDEIVQKINEGIKIKVEEKNLDCSIEEKEKVEEYIKSLIKPFDLSKAPLLRVAIIKLKDSEIMFMDVHHIIVDGVSYEVFMEEFKILYEGGKLGEVKTQYKDFTHWQNELKRNGDLAKQEQYWLDQFKGDIPVLDMKTDYKRKKVQSFRGDHLVFEVEDSLTEKMNKLLVETGTTKHMLFLACMSVLLSKYTSQEDIIIGTPSAGRTHEDVEETMGMFVNTLPIRSYPEGYKKFSQLLNEVRDVTLKASSNQDYQLDMLIDKLNITREEGRNPLFDVMFAVQDFSYNGTIGDLKVENYVIENNRSKIDLSIMVEDNNKNAKIFVEYATDLFKKSTIEYLVECYINVLNEVVKNKDILIKEIDVLNNRQQEEIVKEFNNTKAEYTNKSVKELFEDIVKNYGENIALTAEGKSITYEDLNERANKIANFLKRKGVQKEDTVPVICERNIETVLAMLAVVKSGAVYLPIDNEYPDHRVKYMIEDSKCKVVLANKRDIERISSIDISCEVIDIKDASIEDESCENLKNETSLNDLIYIMYTSGSTGQPKGVCIENRGVVRLVKNNNHLILDEKDKMLKVLSMAFDPTILEVWGCLLNGNELVIAQKDDVLDIDKIEKVIKDNEITVMQISSPLFTSFASQRMSVFDGIKQLIVGGDVLSSRLVEKLLKYNNKIRIINAYGPTENSVTSTCFTVENEWDSSVAIPIGKPISNSTCYIMDKYEKLSPIGVTGELWVGGDGISRGYFNKEVLTREKFVRNPYKPEERIYKTGDLARWLPDGNIEFLGRDDNQVKIRGFRIEIDEIERAMLSLDNIEKAVITDMVNENGEKYLSAYIVSNEDIQINDLKKKLKAKLPTYMIPSSIVKVEEIPLTINGKVDMKKLSEVESIIECKEIIPPTTEMQKKILDIWSEVLGVKEISIDDTFLGIGGDSLRAINIVSKLKKELFVDVEVVDILNEKTLEEISEVLQQRGFKKYSSIKKIDNKEYYEASFAQKRMYSIYEVDKDSIQYNAPGVISTKKSFDIEKVQNCINQIINRHEVLRTSFCVMDEEIVQKIHDDVNIEVESINLELSIKDTDKLDEFIKSLVKPFDLSKAPLFRAAIIKLNDAEIMFTDMPHIITDGVSYEIFMKEFKALYEGEKLEEVQVQYKDFAYWQNELKRNGDLAKQEEYWIDQFKGDIPVLNMRTDYKRNKVQSFKGNHLLVNVDDELRGQIDKLIIETGTTKHMMFLTCMSILLSKYTSQEDIIIGTPFAGRTNVDVENTMGMFINTLPIRSYPEGEKTFAKLLDEVKDVTVRASSNQDYQLDMLIEKLGVAREEGRNPLFDVMFAVQDFRYKGVIGDLEVEDYSVESDVSKVDLSFMINDDNKNTQIFVEYATKLFEKSTIEYLVECYMNILNQVVRNKDILVKEIEVLNNKQQEKIIKDFNNTKAKYPNKSVKELFEEVVESNEEKAAITVEGKTINYKDLNEKANKIANFLIKEGVKKEEAVSVICERSIDTIIAILAVVKSGATYLPIDNEYPEDRVKYMIQDSNSRIVLASNDDVEKIKNINVSCKVIDIKNSSIENESGENLKNETSLNDLIYIMYTSGSTGQPKGVCIENRGVVRLVKNNNHLILDEQDKMLKVLSMAFDPTILEVWGCLLNGNELVIAQKDDVLDVDKIEKIIKENKITIMQISSPLFTSFASQRMSLFDGIKQLIVGGDVLSSSLVEKLLKYNNEIKVINAYGPTENSVTSTCFTVENEWDSSVAIPIGKPISNSTCYVMDKYGKLSPIGVVGELCVGGDGVSRGYLNKKEVTKERFIENPYNKEERIYKTGDLARWLPDGNIEFLGRDDNQVKIRGFRIEIDEIERVILRFDPIKAVVVTDIMGENGEKYLSAYIVSDENVQISKLKKSLRSKLPIYMVPTSIVQVEEIPLTINGKVDLQKLSKIEVKVEEAENLPQTKLQKQLINIFAEVLNIKGIQLDDTFFEVGGDSLKAISIIAKIKDEMDGNITVKDILSNKTIGELAEMLELGNALEDDVVIEKLDKQEYYETSSVQKRMFTVNQMDKESLSYNMPYAMIVKEDISVEKVQDCVDKIVDRHESLRTSFRIENEAVVQKIHEFKRLTVNYSEENYSSEERDKIDMVIKNHIKCFDLEKGYLFRVDLIKLTDAYIIFFDMHHIVSDGRSFLIVLDEFKQLYSGNKLSDNVVQYKDFAYWQNKLNKSEKMKKQEEFWMNEFKDGVPELDMKLDYSRPTKQGNSGDSVMFELDSNLVKAIDSIAAKYRVTKFMLHTAVLNILLSKYCNQKDIVIGTPILGRNKEELMNTVGMFVNTLVIKLAVDNTISLPKFLSYVKDMCLNYFENQDYQFEDLVDKANVKREYGRNPIFDILFAVNEMGENQNYFNGKEVEVLDIDINVVKFDMSFNVNVDKDKTYICIDYRNDLFKKEKIHEIGQYYISVLEQIQINDEVNIQDIVLMSETDKKLSEQLSSKSIIEEIEEFDF